MFAEDEVLRQTIDNFIQNNIKAVTESKKFYGLPQIPVEITGTLLEKDKFKLLLGNGNFTMLRSYPNSYEFKNNIDYQYK